MNVVAKVVPYKKWQAIVEDDNLYMYEPLRKNVVYARLSLFHNTKGFQFGSEINSQDYKQNYGTGKYHHPLRLPSLLCVYSQHNILSHPYFTYARASPY